jgi:hypothetical protein
VQHGTEILGPTKNSAFHSSLWNVSGDWVRSSGVFKSHACSAHMDGRLPSTLGCYREPGRHSSHDSKNKTQSSGFFCCSRSGWTRARTTSIGDNCDNFLWDQITGWPYSLLSYLAPQPSSDGNDFQNLSKCALEAKPLLNGFRYHLASIPFPSQSM